MHSIDFFLFVEREIYKKEFENLLKMMMIIFKEKKKQHTKETSLVVDTYKSIQCKQKQQTNTMNGQKMINE